MPPIKRPAVRGIVLGEELRRRRVAAKLSLQAVSEATGISQPTLSRIEHGTTILRKEHVGVLLELYGVDAADQALLLELAETPTRRGWWQNREYADLFPSGLPAMERDADAFCTWTESVVPGLLQTEDYYRALIAVTNVVALEGTEVDRRVRARLARQTIVRSAPLRTLHFVLSETAIRQMIGGGEVMQAQVLALWQASQLPNVTMQVVPFAAGAHPGLGGSFTIFNFTDPDRQIAHTEGPGGSIYLESASALEEINVRWEGILKAALAPDESADLLKGVADSLSKE